MKNKIKYILLHTLHSAYDGGTIDDGGIMGGDNAVDQLYDLFVDETTAIGTATPSSKPEPEKPKKIGDILYTNPETGKNQKLFDILLSVYTVKYANPECGNKGEAVFITLNAEDELNAMNKAMCNEEFKRHIQQQHFNRKYLIAYIPVGNYVIGRVEHYEGDERL